MHTPLEIAKALIHCRSITPHEAGALSYIEDLLTPQGFTCHYLTFEEEGTAPVANLYARIGDGAPHICFAGHTDVVPPGDESAWVHPPFEGVVKEGHLFGRGACDMKGGVAASLAAVLRYLRERKAPSDGSISFLITGDEEAVAINGTKKVVEWLKNRDEVPTFCLLPECTAEHAAADTLKLGRRGSLSTELTVRGLQGHAAHPHKARNPITGLVNVLSLLKATPLDEGTADFQPSNLEISSIDTDNPAHNVIPAAVTARFNIRFNDLHTHESLKRWIEEKVQTGLEGRELSYSLKWEKGGDCFLTKHSTWVDDLSAVVATVTGKAPGFSTSGGTSDARFIKDLCPVVEVGLPNTTAHKVDENITVADLETLTEVFVKFLEKALG